MAMMTTYPPLAVERSARRMPFIPGPPRRVIRVCLAHELPLREEYCPMRCALGHPVEDSSGWVAVDVASGKIVGHPHGEMRKGEMP